MQQLGWKYPLQLAGGSPCRRSKCVQGLTYQPRPGARYFFPHSCYSRQSVLNESHAGRGSTVSPLPKSSRSQFEIQGHTLKSIDSSNWVDTKDCADQTVHLVALGVYFTKDGIHQRREESIIRYYLRHLRPADPLYTPEEKGHATP